MIQAAFKEIIRLPVLAGDYFSVFQSIPFMLAVPSLR